LTKNVGASPTVHYPEGRVRDVNGAQLNAQDEAIMMADNLDRNNPVVIPSNVEQILEAYMERGTMPSPKDIEQLQKWRIEWNESTGGADGAFIEGLRYSEHQAYKHWKVLPRAVEEGQFGTKAEAGTHTDLMKEMAQIEIEDILQSMNQNLIDDLLVINFGEEARGTVYLEAPEVDAAAIEFARQLVLAVYGNSSNMGEFDERINEGELLEITRLPHKSDDEMEEGGMINIKQPLNEKSRTTDNTKEVNKEQETSQEEENVQN